MFGETVVDHEKKWQRFKRAFNDRYTELRSELSEARNMADIYERSLDQKTDSSKSEEIEAGIIALKLIGRARLPKGSSDRYPKILEEMKAIRKYVDVLSVHNMERMRFKAIAAQVTEAKKNNLLYTRRRKINQRKLPDLLKKMELSRRKYLMKEKNRPVFSRDWIVLTQTFAIGQLFRMYLVMKRPLNS